MPITYMLIYMLISLQHGASQEDFLRANATQAVKDSVFDFASLAHTHLLKASSSSKCVAQQKTSLIPAMSHIQARSLRSQLPVVSNSSKAMLPAVS